MTPHAATQDLEGKTFFITGANAGIGRATALELGRRGGKVWVACRTTDKAKPVVEAIRAAGGDAKALAIDLGDLASVCRCAQEFLRQGQALDVLINNAGLAGIRGTTQDGFEVHFGVNHLGPFLLTQLLLPALQKRAHSRIVNVASRAHYRASSIDFAAVRRPTATYVGMHEYSVSKLANVLHAKELARRYGSTGVHTYSVHPGVVASDIWKRRLGVFAKLMTLWMITNEEGALTSLHCATSAQAGSETGLYYDRQKPKRPNAVANDEGLARELWEQSEAMIASVTSKVAASV